MEVTWSDFTLILSLCIGFLLGFAGLPGYVQERFGRLYQYVATKFESSDLKENGFEDSTSLVNNDTIKLQFGLVDSGSSEDSDSESGEESDEESNQATELTLALMDLSQMEKHLSVPVKLNGKDLDGMIGSAIGVTFITEELCKSICPNCEIQKDGSMEPDEFYGSELKFNGHISLEFEYGTFKETVKVCVGTSSIDFNGFIIGADLLDALKKQDICLMSDLTKNQAEPMKVLNLEDCYIEQESLDALMSVLSKYGIQYNPSQIKIE